MGDLEDFDDFDTVDMSLEDNIPEGIWITKDGKRLKITEMETSHLVNTINFLKRRDGNYVSSYNPKIKELEAELKKRQSYIMVDRSVTISEDDLKQILRSKGVQLPKSGCQFVLADGQILIGGVTAKWSDTEPLRPTFSYQHHMPEITTRLGQKSKRRKKK